MDSLQLETHIFLVEIPYPSSWALRLYHYPYSLYYTLRTSWSIKVSIAAPKFATSTLMTASLKVVTIECIERDVTCLIGRVSYA